MSRAYVAALVASCIAATASDAQSRDSLAARDSARARRAVQRLEPMQVRASVAPTAGPAVRGDVPARIAIVSGAAIDAWEPRTLADALGAQVGISIVDDLGSPYKLNIASRGFGVGPTVGSPAGLTVFLDGIRQNEPDAQEVNFDLLPMEHVARVELLGGTASLLGPNSLGGVINLITERGHGPPSGELELTAGSFGALAGEARVSGRANTGWDYYASGGIEHERGWRDATDGRNGNVFVNAGKIGESRGVSVQLYGARSRAETAGSLPESIARTAPRTNFTAGDYENLHGVQAALSGFAPLFRGSTSMSLYARGSTARRLNVNQAPDPDALGDTRNATVGASGDWRATMLGDALSLRVGADAAASRVRVRIHTIAHDVVAESVLTTDVRSPTASVAAFALADAHVGRATLSLGARWDRVRIPFHDLLDAATSETHTFANVSPRAGASVALGRGASVYASAGESFRAPAILELACADPEAACPLPFALGDDPPLRPVRARTLETGARWTHGTLVASGSLYRTDVRDEVFFVASPTARLSGYFTNLARTRRAGVELSLEGSARDGQFAWYANHAWTSATFRSAAALFSLRSEDEFATSPFAGGNVVRAGDRLPLVPAQQTKAGASLQLTRRWELGVDARWIGAQWLRGDEANETPMLDAYVQVNVRAAYERAGWRIAAIVDKALDDHSFTFGTYNENRRTGALERFVTPLGARTVRIVIRRSLGRLSAADRAGDPGDP